MGLRTGDEYLAGLDDHREIWFNGEKIDDTQRMKSMNYQFYDKTEAAALVARILTPPSGRERLAWPDQYRPTP